MLLTLSLLVMVGGVAALFFGILRPPTPTRRVVLFTAISIAHLGTGLFFMQTLPTGIVSNIAVVLTFGGALIFAVGAVRSCAARRG